MRIDTIREKLKLSREDIAIYLGISKHMVKAIELNKRNVSFDIMLDVAAMANAILKSKVPPMTTDIAPATSQQIQQMNHLHRIYSRRLRNYTVQLEKMKEVYTAAARSLGIYQRFSESLTSTVADRVRVKWVNWKIEESTQRVQKNNLTAQKILAMEIAGLQIRINRLEKLGLLAQ